MSNVNLKFNLLPTPFSHKRTSLRETKPTDLRTLRSMQSVFSGNSPASAPSTPPKTFLIPSASSSSEPSKGWSKTAKILTGLAATLTAGYVLSRLGISPLGGGTKPLTDPTGTNMPNPAQSDIDVVPPVGSSQAGGAAISEVNMPTDVSINLEDITEEAKHGLARLTILDASNQHLNDSQFEIFAKLLNPELQSLDLRNNSITDAGLSHLYRFTKLQNLILEGNQITHEGLQNLLKHLPQFKTEGS